MKNSKTYKFCEYCDTQIEDVSPPSKKSYKDGIIQIGSGSILLNNPLSNNHASFIEGIYCNIDCLTKHLQKLRRNGVKLNKSLDKPELRGA